MFGALICFRGYAANPELSELFLRFAKAGDLRVGKYYAPADKRYKHIVVSEKCGTLEYWVANGQFAFASQGSIALPFDGKKIEWDDEMPGRWAIFKFQFATRHLKFARPFSLK